ncbi:hypothetical protein Q4519_20730 [Motilimonas sp. 1_MG-2023]|uniref:hypothetical protein n=1 Tax=Motilimonas sp. 1_MG-2023 TaxID=3062672 RepID=UPI0026E23CAB|nr:hypothetical protein [Motilimonas sp. 1_MG-2023]MDO6528101.1 hypothetical protein [Motilimonas sp. 1_MG-2023]
MKSLLTHLTLLAIMPLLFFGQAAFASVQKGLAWTQQGEWWEAEPLFLAEAEKGNPEAMFWLAKTQMRMGGKGYLHWDDGWRRQQGKEIHGQ